MINNWVSSTLGVEFFAYNFHCATVQLNLNFTHMCQYTHVFACLPHVKLKKMVCTSTVACNFGMQMIASEHMQNVSDVHHQLALGLPHYTCGV